MQPAGPLVAAVNPASISPIPDLAAVGSGGPLLIPISPIFAVAASNARSHSDVVALLAASVELSAASDDDDVKSTLPARMFL